MMNANDNEEIKRRRLGSPGKVAAADDAPRRNDTVSRLEQRMGLMEASFQREILEIKRGGVELLAKNKVIESQLSSLQDDNKRLKARVSQLDEENRRLESAFKLHVENMDWEYDAPDPPPDSYWREQGYDYDNEEITDEDYIDSINETFFQRAEKQSEKLRRGTFGLQNDSEELYFGDSDENGLLIRYDDALLPHWKEFCKAMNYWQRFDIRGGVERTHPFRVDIGNVELPGNVLDMLRECFEPGGSGYMEELHLMSNIFQGSDGIEFALKIMQSEV